MGDYKFDKEAQYDVLLKFFYQCVRFWEKELNVDSDLDRQPYENALNEIPKHYPYAPNGELFDPAVREAFIKSRYMDTYGHNWEKYYLSRVES